MIAIGIVATPAFARLTRAQRLTIREREFVQRRGSIGASPLAIVSRHIWPNVTAPIIVQATLLVATAILTEASLSFLGVGVKPPTPTWGSMLRTGSNTWKSPRGWRSRPGWRSSRRFWHSTSSATAFAVRSTRAC